MSSFWDGSGHMYVMSQPNRPGLCDCRALWLTVAWLSHRHSTSATVYQHPPQSISIRRSLPSYFKILLVFFFSTHTKSDLLVERVSKSSLSSFNALPWHPVKQDSCPSTLPLGDGDLEIRQERFGSELHSSCWLLVSHRSTFCISSSASEAIICLTVDRNFFILHRC